LLALRIYVIYDTIQYDFQGFSVSQGKVRTLNRRDGKLNHVSSAYSRSNICIKNYQNRVATIKIVVGGWVVYFFETVW